MERYRRQPARFRERQATSALDQTWEWGRYQKMSTDEAPQARPQHRRQPRRPLESDTSSHLNCAHHWYFGTSTDHLPSVALMPSHTAPTNPVTITVMTA